MVLIIGGCVMATMLWLRARAQAGRLARENKQLRYERSQLTRANATQAQRLFRWAWHSAQQARQLHAVQHHPVAASHHNDVGLMQTAIFLDLDHTLIRPASGATFPKDSTDWEFMPGMLERLCQALTAYPRPIVIVTNQGGVPAGYHTQEEIEAKLDAIKHAMRGSLPDFGVHHYCAYADDYDRKPLPGMAYRAALALDLDLAGSMMVGDLPSDLTFAQNAGIRHFHWAKDFVREL